MTDGIPKEQYISPFKNRSKDWLDQNDHAYLVYVDQDFAVCPGHSLIFSKRFVHSSFDLIDEEMLGIFVLAKAHQKRLITDFNASGFNLGWNIGEPAGQTVHHAHLHMIPRQEGDHPSPKGGILKNLFDTAPDYYA